jgi:hypothetical protein
VDFDVKIFLKISIKSEVMKILESPSSNYVEIAAQALARENGAMVYWFPSSHRYIKTNSLQNTL